MPTLKKYDVRDEEEVHSIIEKEIDAFEEGAKILKHEFQCGDRGTVDFLFVDSGNRLGLIEVKKDKDDDMLFQGLNYYDWVYRNIYAVKNMFPSDNINPNEHPRLVLAAGQISDNLRNLTTHVKPDVELYEYSLLEDAEGNIGIDFHPVPQPKIIEAPEKPNTIKDVLNYITNDKIKDICKDAIDKIKNIHKDVDAYATVDYIGFRYKGRQIAYIWTYRKAFDIAGVRLDENLHIMDWDTIRIESDDENYSTQLETIKEALKALGANFPEKK